MRWIRSIARWWLRLTRPHPLPTGPIPRALAGAFLVEVGKDEVGDPVLGFDNGLVLRVGFVRGSGVVVYTVLDGQDVLSEETTFARLGETRGD